MNRFDATMYTSSSKVARRINTDPPKPDTDKNISSSLVSGAAAIQRAGGDVEAIMNMKFSDALATLARNNVTATFKYTK